MRRVEARAKPFCGFARSCGARSLRPQLRQLPHAHRRCDSMMHPVSTRREWRGLTPTTLGDEQRDAGQDYLESDSEASRICLRDRATRGADGGSGADGRHRAASPESAAVRGVRSGGPGVRPAGAAPLRVRPAVGPDIGVGVEEAQRGELVEERAIEGDLRGAVPGVDRR